VGLVWGRFMTMAIGFESEGFRVLEGNGWKRMGEKEDGEEEN